MPLTTPGSPADRRHATTTGTTLRVRSIWISDVHLGTRACKAEFLLDFLKHTDSRHLYLIGDIIDFWSLRNGWYFPPLHNQILQSILEKAANGTRVVYVPGNHDEVLRDYVGRVFGGVRIEKNTIHTTADGRRFLVIHGDELDVVVRHSRWVAKMGSRAYDFLLWSNRLVNVVRRRLGLPYWSLAAYLKHKVKNAVNFISNFEQALAHEARRCAVDGVICGHIHRATVEDIHGVLYCNDGDWVESCTALLERDNGALALLHWGDARTILFEETRPNASERRQRRRAAA